MGSGDAPCQCDSPGHRHVRQGYSARMRRRVAGPWRGLTRVLVAVAVLAACTSEQESAPSATPATDSASTTSGTTETTDATDATDTTDSPGGSDTTVESTAAPSSAPVSTEVGVPAPAGRCGFTTPGASITYVADGRLFELSTDERSAICLAELGGPLSGPVTWSPAGDQVLLGSDLVMDADEIRETGYLAENRGVQWSFPSGKAFIAPAVADGVLLWRSSADENNRIDVSFLASTDVAVYHPAGKNIIAAGMGLDGVAGLYLASNRGENARVITTLDDPSTSITEIAVDPSGVTSYFVHDHGDVRHIHQLSLQGLQLMDMAVTSEQVGHLTLGTFFGGRLAYREGDCAGVVSTKLANGSFGDLMSSPELDGRSVVPAGWLDYQRLVVEVRDVGCDGPAEVWVMSTDGAVHQVLGTVEAVAVRTVLDSFGELPDDINAQAPG